MKKLIQSLFVLTIFISLTAQNAYAFPLPRGDEDMLQARSLSERGLFTQNYDFEGIVKLSNCSGSLVRYETSKDTDLAMVLTNGHCLNLGGFLQPGEIVHNKSIFRSFDLYNSQIQVVARLNASAILYGTMTGTDLALYRLTETYLDIKNKYQINPLVLSSTPADLNQPIEILSGYWKRGYSCAIEKFIGVLEEAGWTFTDSIRYSRPGCETIGGTSGSPIINPITRAVVGVNNTGNESGQLCTMNNPCEVDENGNKKAYKGYSYGQQVYWVYTCLNEQNEIDLDKEGCLLHQ